MRKSSEMQMRTLTDIPVLQLNQASKFNDAVFSPEIVQQAIMDLYDDIGTMNCLVGLLHSGKDFPVMNLPINQTSHLITSLYINSDIVFADLIILDTKTGKQLQKLIDKDQARFALSGTGDITTDYHVTFYKIFTVTAYDIRKK
jgi:hypothetical protein